VVLSAVARAALPTAMTTVIAHQKKTCEMITPHGVIRQFPANGHLITPRMS
jgi:hypothetical protein